MPDDKIKFPPDSPIFNFIFDNNLLRRYGLLPMRLFMRCIDTLSDHHNEVDSRTRAASGDDETIMTGYAYQVLSPGANLESAGRVKPPPSPAQREIGESSPDTSPAMFFHQDDPTGITWGYAGMHDLFRAHHDSIIYGDRGEIDERALTEIRRVLEVEDDSFIEALLGNAAAMQKLREDPQARAVLKDYGEKSTGDWLDRYLCRKLAQDENTGIFFFVSDDEGGQRGGGAKSANAYILAALEKHNVRDLCFFPSMDQFIALASKIQSSLYPDDADSTLVPTVIASHLTRKGLELVSEMQEHVGHIEIDGDRDESGKRSKYRIFKDEFMDRRELNQELFTAFKEFLQNWMMGEHLKRANVAIARIEDEWSQTLRQMQPLAQFMVEAIDGPLITDRKISAPIARKLAALQKSLQQGAGLSA